MEQALLAVSFGTSVPSARESIDAVERALRQTAPELQFVRAFTSPTIRGILARRGEVIPDVEGALAQLRDGGIRRVAVQPTYVLCGAEYDRTREAVEAFRPHFERLALGKPLLAGTEDLLRLARCVEEAYHPQQEALVLLGHGTDHFANAAYPALQTVFRLRGMEQVYVGTVEGWPGFAEVLAQLKGDGHRRVRLAPLMLVAGDHAVHDMAGEDAASWRSRLEAEGIQVTCQMTGLGQLPDIQRIYCDHLRECL